MKKSVKLSFLLTAMGWSACGGTQPGPGTVDALAVGSSDAAVEGRRPADATNDPVAAPSDTSPADAFSAIAGDAGASDVFNHDAVTPPTVVVQTCKPSAYVDRSPSDADRTLAWTHGFGDEERCLIVRAGQSVLWQGNLSTHPLDADGGDTPNPIVSHRDGLVTFPTPGTFGYVCGAGHAGMHGAVHVVPGKTKG